MAIVGLLTLIVCVIGLVIWFALGGFTKAQAAEAGKIMFAAGLLAFLFASSAQSCSMGTGGTSSSGVKR